MSFITNETDTIVPETMEKQEAVEAIIQKLDLIVLDDPEQSADTTIIMATIEKGELVTLATLPSELHVKIFKYLDRASSTCFGLTSHKFYPIHKDLRGTVPLAACCLYYPSRASRCFLFGLLKEWMGVAGLEFNKSELKFVTTRRNFDIKDYDAWWHMMEIALPSPMQLKLAKAKEKRRLEIMRDEKEAGGWWEKGVWVDGEKGGKGRLRWIELEYEGVEWEGAGDEVTMADTSWW